MSKVTNYQRMIRSGHPFTVITAVRVPKVEATPTGPVPYVVQAYQVTGFTYEHKFIDEEWHRVWESHDLGQQATREIAHEVTAEWKEALVGQYECG